MLGSIWPEGNFWASLLKLFDVGSYAWTIIIFTIVLKIVISPLDVTQRFYTNKTTRAQAKLQPELEKLKKRYGQNTTLLYQKQNELYQKSGYSMKGSCIIMFLYMIVNFAVFITFFNSLQFVAGFEIKRQYNELQEVYISSYNVGYLQDYLEIDLESDEYKNVEDKNSYISLKEENKANTIATEQTISIESAREVVSTYKIGVQEQAQDEVVNKYNDIKDSWLWVKNIWRGDKLTVKEISSYNEYVASTGENSVSEETYNLVMAKLINGDESINRVNGYYILSVIVVVLSFVSQLIIRKTSQPKSKLGQSVNIQQPNATKILMFVMPFAMLIFTLNSSAMFSLYVITNTLMSTLITPFSVFVSNKIEDNNERKRQESIKVDYRR